MASDMPITSHFPMRKRRALGLGLLEGRQKRATTTEAKKDTEKTPEARTKISLRRAKNHSPSDKSSNQPLKTPTRAQFPNALVRLRKTPRRLAAWGGGYASDSGPEITWDNNSPSPTKPFEKAKGNGLLASKDPEQLASILKKLSRNKVLNKEDDKTSNLFNSWMEREDTSNGRRSERLIGKGKRKKRSVLNLAKPPEVAPEQRLSRKRGRAGTWNGMEFRKELSKFIENINEIGQELHRPQTNDEAAQNEQPNQDQIVDAEDFLLEDDDSPSLFEDLNAAGNDIPPAARNAREENGKAANAADNTVKLEEATDVKENAIRDEARAICSDVPFDADDDLGDDIFVEIDELPKHDRNNDRKLSTVSTKSNLTAEKDLPSFGKELSKGSSAKAAGSNSKTNFSSKKLLPERSYQNGQKLPLVNTGNEREFANSNSSAEFTTGKFTRDCQNVPMNNIVNRREVHKGSYTNGTVLPNRKDANGRNLPQYNDTNDQNMTAGFSADGKLRSSNRCTDSKGSLNVIDTRTRTSTSDARTLSTGKKISMNPPIKPAPKNTLKSVAPGKTQLTLGKTQLTLGKTQLTLGKTQLTPGETQLTLGKTQLTLGKTQRMNNGNVEMLRQNNRYEKSSKGKERVTKQSLQRNVDEKEKESDNLEDSLDLDCLGDLSLDEEFECCLIEGKQTTGSKSKNEVFLRNEVSSITKKQHKAEVRAEEVKKIDDIDIEEWEEDMFIDAEDLSSDVIKGMTNASKAKENNGIDINLVDNDLDDFLAFDFDEQDCKIADGLGSTKENRCDSTKKAVQSKENLKNGNRNCYKEVANNHLKAGEDDHLIDMDCEFDDLDFSERCLQDLEVKNDCKESNMRNMKAAYIAGETKRVGPPRSCNATGFGHNVRKDVVDKMSLKPSTSTNVERVMDISYMKKTTTDVANKEYGFKNMNPISCTSKVNDKIRTERNLVRDSKAAKGNLFNAESNSAVIEKCFNKDTEDDLDAMNFDLDDDELDIIDLSQLEKVLDKEDLSKRVTREPEVRKPFAGNNNKVTNRASNFGQPKRNVNTDTANRVRNGDIVEEDKADELCNDLADFLDDDFSEGCLEDFEQKTNKYPTEKATLVRRNTTVDRLHDEKTSEDTSKSIASVGKGVGAMSKSNKAVSGGPSCFANRNRGKDALGVPRMSTNTVNCELKSTKSTTCISKVASTETTTVIRNKFKFRRSGGTDGNTAAGSAKVNCDIKKPIADNVTNTKNLTRTSMLPPNTKTADNRTLDTMVKAPAQLHNPQQALSNSSKPEGIKALNIKNVDNGKQVPLNKRPIQNAVGADVSVIAKGSRPSGEFVALDADDDFWDDVEIGAKCQVTLPITSTQKLDTRAKENTIIDASTATQKYTMQDIEKKKAEAKRKLQQKMIKEKQDKALKRLMKNKR